MQIDKTKFEHKYVTDFANGFYYMELIANSYQNSYVLDQNVIIFIIDGRCSFSYNQYTNRVFSAGDMMSSPKSAVMTGFVFRRCEICIYEI